MVDERALLMRAFDTLAIAAVRGPDRHGRVSLDLKGEGWIDLGPAGTPAADAAMAWRSRRVAEWLDAAPAAA